MAERIDFLKDPPTNFFGAFYPVGYGVLAFQDEGDAEKIKALLLADGFEEADITIVLARDLLKAEGGGVGEVDDVAKAVGGETRDMKKHEELARAGATFVMVFVPEDADADKLSHVLKAFQPLTADRYNLLTISGF